MTAAPSDAVGESAGLLAISPGLFLVGLAGLVLASLGFQAAASLLVYSPTKLHKRLRNGKRASIVGELEQRDEEFQITARMLALAGIAGAFLCMEASVEGTLKPWILLALGLLALMFCGVLPAAMAESRAETTLLRALPVLRASLWMLRYPLVWPVRAVKRAMMRLFRIPDAPITDREEIADEIMAAVSDSANENALAEEEKSWIGNIVELTELNVSEAMTPRTDVVAMAADTPLREAVAEALETGFSRYPVFEEKVDNVVGVFYAKDALRLSQEASGQDQANWQPETPVRAVMREPLFVPESMGVVQLLSKFKATKLQMAIVLDEYGGTAGLISIEDIIEEIVGDISDEYDSDEEVPIKVVEQGRVLEISARTRVEEVNDQLGTELPEDGDYDTIAGFVISYLGRIPAVGETFQVDGVEFQILRADDRRLGRMRVAAMQIYTADDDG